MSYISKSDLEIILDQKWREYKNLYENGRVTEKEYARHAMLSVRSLEREVKQHFEKKNLF